ncbi:hypothetical protein C0V78_13220 [Novosphingobium sp. TH158]|nr:hypothetical protein C0V78_13220 [Novosphingobium sp. TH158]
MPIHPLHPFPPRPRFHSIWVVDGGHGDDHFLAAALAEAEFAVALFEEVGDQADGHGGGLSGWVFAGVTGQG